MKTGGWGLSIHKSWHKSSKLFQIRSECTIYRPCFHCFSAVPNHFKYLHNAQFTILVFKKIRQFQIISNTIRRQNARFRDIVFKMFSAVPNCLKYHQNACLKDIVFKIFFAVPSRLKYRHSAYFKDIVFIFSQQFQIVSNTVRTHSSATFFSKGFLQFEIVLNTVRMHSLETLFSKKICSSKSFQLPSQCMLYTDIVFTFFSPVSNRFKCHQNASFRGIVFQKSAIPNLFKYRQMHAWETLISKELLQFQIILNTIRLHA